MISTTSVIGVLYCLLTCVPQQASGACQLNAGAFCLDTQSIPRLVLFKGIDTKAKFDQMCTNLKPSLVKCFADKTDSCTKEQLLTLSLPTLSVNVYSEVCKLNYPAVNDSFQCLARVEAKPKWSGCNSDLSLVGNEFPNKHRMCKKANEAMKCFRDQIDADCSSNVTKLFGTVFEKASADVTRRFDCSITVFHDLTGSGATSLHVGIVTLLFGLICRYFI